MSTTKKITVYNTKGGQPKTFESSAEKWGDLREEIKGQGFAVDNLLATESVTRRDLNNVEAILPEGDFTVFLRPKKTKSGALGYKEAKQKIKELIEKHGEAARNHFCNNPDFPGKNYTTMSTADINTMLDTWKAPAQEESSSSPVTEDAGEQMSEERADNGVGEVVADVAASKEEEPKKLSPSEKIDAAIALITEAAEETDDEDILDRAEDQVAELKGLKADVVAWEDPEADARRREEEEAERLRQEEEDRKKREAEEERQRLDAEARGLMGGFND